MIKVEFSGNTADEVNEQVKDYASKIKGSRGGKGGSTADEGAQTGNAPAPMMPPTGGAAPGGPPPLPAGGPVFAPPAGAAGAPGAFPAAGAPPVAPSPGPSPETAALVQRINARIDGAIQSGQPTDAVLQWFRNQCGPEAAQATLDQIKQNLLYKLPMANLTEIAKMMNA